MLFSQKGHFPWENFQFCSESFWLSVKQMEQTSAQLLTWKALSAVLRGGKKSNGQRPAEGEAKGQIQAFSCFMSSLAYECPTVHSKIYAIVWPEESYRNFWALSALFPSVEGNSPFSGESSSSPFSLALSNSSPCLWNHSTVLEGFCGVAPELQDPSRISKGVLTENKQVHLDSSG